MRSIALRLCSIAIALAVFALLAGPASAQISAEKGAIRLVVTDQQGATVAAAKVTLSSGTSASQEKETGADGSVVFALLEPGAYRVVVESSNFKRSVLGSVAVHVTEVTSLNIVLELGSLATEVTVSGDAAETVNTVNATLGNVLAGNVLHDMPLATRNFTSLLALNAGTSSDLPNATDAGRGLPVVFVAGQRGTANNLVINGTDANDLGGNNFSTVPVPSLDSIEEFRVQTSLYDASQGKTSGGNINVLTRGGTDKYHGEVYEFFRNDDLNANLFFLNAKNAARPELKQNQFGGNFGGPVPKLHDTFFFGSYQGTRQINGVAGGISTQFPVLPSSRSAADISNAFLGGAPVDPVAVALLNAPGRYDGFLIPSGSGTVGKFGGTAFSFPLKFNEDQFNANADHLIGTRHKLSERFFYSNSNTINPLGGEDGASFGSGTTAPLDNRLATLAWTYTITPNLVNEARFGFDRIVTSTTPAPTATLASVGMSRFNQSQFSDIPVLLTGDLASEFGGISTNFDQAETNNTFHFADTIAWTHGKHSFRGGFEYRRYQINLFNNFASRGALVFGSFDDFLQGNILESFVGTGQTDRGFRARDASAYFQDDWKITKRLSLNLGIRYDYLGPSTDVKGRLGNFDPSLLDAETRANGGPGILNGFILPSSANFGDIKGTPGVSSSTLLSNSPHNFAPRIGVAWDPFGDGKTSIRSGFGIYYIRISNQMLLQLITGEPFFQLSALLFPGTTLADPFPNLPVASQFPIFSTPPTFTGLDAGGNANFDGDLLALNPFFRNLGTPYTENWNFSIQRELPMHFSVEAGYIGSEGVKLLQGLQVNQATLANADHPIIVGGANGVPQSTITTNTLGNLPARAGVLGFDPGSGLNTVTELGHSSYNAFIFTLNRRTANVFLQAAYTFSKSIDNNSGSPTQDLGGSLNNQVDLRGVRGLSDFNRTHRLQATYQYTIPGFASGALHHILGSWTVGGLSTFQSGLPLTFTCSSCPNNILGISTNSVFPEVVGDLNQLMKSGRPENFTTTSVFNDGVLAPVSSISGTVTVSGLNNLGGPGNESFTITCGAFPNDCGLFGNMGRNNPRFHGPFQQNWDVFLSKKFTLTERMNLVFRSEFFNVFNHPNFAITNTDIGSPAFGHYDTTVGNPRIIQLALKLQF